MEEESLLDDSVFTHEGLVGELDAMCSVAEAQLRTETRQVDRFELASSATNGHIMIDLAKAVKKYQRSSADKKYLPAEVRTIPACWRTVEYLFTNLLDFEIHPKPGYNDICYRSTFFEIYSFLRDRLRAVRVDLHVQNAAGDPTFIAVHELCLRFELLSIFLLWGRDFGQSEDRRFDLHLSLTALSQTIDPLSNAYTKRRLRGSLTRKELETEAEINSYVLLLSLTSRGGSKTFKSHYLKQPAEIKNHESVKNAFETVSAYYAGNWIEFVEKYRNSSFLAACCMLPVINIARNRILWRTVRTNRPFFIRKDPSTGAMPAPRPEKIALSKMTEMLGFKSENECSKFLSFQGLDCTTGSVCQIPPRQLTRNPVTWWTSSAEWRVRAQDGRDFPDFAWNENLLEAFHSHIGEDVGDDKPPERCEYPKQVELILEDKYMRELDAKKSRKNIVIAQGGFVASSVPTTPLIIPTTFVSPQPPVPASNLGPIPTFFPSVFEKSPAPAPAPVNVVFAAPAKPERPVVPLEPLDVQKRPRDSPEKVTLPSVFEKPPTKKLHEEIQLPVAVVAPPPLLPALPPVGSGFELLAAEFERVVIFRDQPSPQIAPPELMEEDLTRELVISERRLKYVAMRCLRNWSNLSSETHRWKWMLGSTVRAPARLNP
jgi:hypothetical protein